jgi:hypothetical protein
MVGLIRRLAGAVLVVTGKGQRDSILKTSQNEMDNGLNIRCLVLKPNTRRRFRTPHSYSH